MYTTYWSLCRRNKQIYTFEVYFLHFTVFRSAFLENFSEISTEGLENSATKSQGVTKLDSLDDNLRIKYKICKNIFSSDYFESKNLNVVDPERNRVYKKIKRQRDIHSKLYKTVRKKGLVYGSKEVDEYNNPYQLHPISIYNRSENIFLFSCVVKKQDTDIYKQYFISEEYNMSAASYKSSTIAPIAGRFIFGSNFEEILQIQAVALESSAKPFGRKRRESIEFFYLDKKLSHATGK